jgi:hypothetical protein
MMIEKLQKFKDDYCRATGNRCDKFICPITLQECPDADVIDGHILNLSLRSASRATVPQYGPVDHFYGHTVEPDVVRFLNLQRNNLVESITKSSWLTVRLASGEEISAFPVLTKRAERAAAKKFPIAEVTSAGNSIRLALHTTMSNPSLPINGEIEVASIHTFTPAHWNAAMLKVGYLTLFHLMGYSAVFDPCGDTVRRTLAEFYNDKASVSGATKHFDAYGNVTKILGHGQGRPEDLGVNYSRVNFDSLKDGVMLFHQTPRGTFFAVTLAYKVNEVTIGVTLPQCNSNGDHAEATRFYKRLMQIDRTLPQKVTPGVFKGNRFELATGSVNVYSVE